jgi:hypothetical protein
MIEAKDLTKRYGDKLAVDDLSFSVLTIGVTQAKWATMSPTMRRATTPPT